VTEEQWTDSPMADEPMTLTAWKWRWWQEHGYTVDVRTGHVSFPDEPTVRWDLVAEILMQTSSRHPNAQSRELRVRRAMGILRQRFGDEIPLTYTVLGRQLGISQERVRQVLAEALADLRQADPRAVAMPHGTALHHAAWRLCDARYPCVVTGTDR
jgi:hypothetical protein